MDGVAHRLLERDDRRVEPVRLDRVGLRDDELLGEAAVDVDADDAQVAAQVHVAAAALGAGPVEQVGLDADEVALLDARHARPGRDHRAGQLVAQHARRLEVLGGPVVPGEEVEVRRVVPQMLAASTRSSTSPGPGAGAGRSTSSAPGPGRVLASARIVPAPMVAVMAGSIGRGPNDWPPATPPRTAYPPLPAPTSPAFEAPDEHTTVPRGPSAGGGENRRGRPEAPLAALLSFVFPGPGSSTTARRAWPRRSRHRSPYCSAYSSLPS